MQVPSGEVLEECGDFIHFKPDMSCSWLVVSNGQNLNEGVKCKKKKKKKRKKERKEKKIEHIILSSPGPPKP